MVQMMYSKMTDPEAVSLKGLYCCLDHIAPIYSKNQSQTNYFLSLFYEKFILKQNAADLIRGVKVEFIFKQQTSKELS